MKCPSRSFARTLRTTAHDVRGGFVSAFSHRMKSPIPSVVCGDLTHCSIFRATRCGTGNDRCADQESNGAVQPPPYGFNGRGRSKKVALVPPDARRPPNSPLARDVMLDALAGAIDLANQVREVAGIVHEVDLGSIHHQQWRFVIIEK